MNKAKCVLVCGIGERASAVARRLLAEGYAVAIHQSTPPRTLRRRMSFADAWFDGAAALKGVEGRRVAIGSEFLSGLQSRQFIPVLRQAFVEVVERWPWDAIVAAPDDDEHVVVQRFLNFADVTIGVGAGLLPGIDCELVIETEGPDPGAVLRSGAVLQRRETTCRSALEAWDVLAPISGTLRAEKTIGATVEMGERLGFVGDDEVCAPVAGRLKGLAHKMQTLVENSPLAEIALSSVAPVAGVSRRNELIARGVAFAVEMETEGWSPMSFGRNF
jgi:xanthine dehydrogenase accessory factor